VNYQAPHSLSAGDGAGAAIVGHSDRYVIMDFAEETYSDDEDYHGMSLKVRVHERHGVRTLRVDEHGLPVPTFEISAGGRRSFLGHGVTEPPRLIGQMLERHGISCDEIALIGHQGPNAMMDRWSEKIRPKQYLHTMEQYGALALASVPVTLASCVEQVKTKYLVLASPGLGVHFAVLLIRV
jgi:3-oxoacyl-[acyl-carrier-protein] synthase III